MQNGSLRSVRKVLQLRTCKFVIRLPHWYVYSYSWKWESVSAILSALKSEEQGFVF